MLLPFCLICKHCLCLCMCLITSEKQTCILWHKIGINYPNLLWCCSFCSYLHSSVLCVCVSMSVLFTLQNGWLNVCSFVRVSVRNVQGRGWCDNVYAREKGQPKTRGTGIDRGNVVLNQGKITTLCHPRAADTVCFWLFSIHFILYLVRSIIVFFPLSLSPLRSLAIYFLATLPSNECAAVPLPIKNASAHTHTQSIFTSQNKRWTSSNVCTKWFRWCDCDVCISEWACVWMRVVGHIQWRAWWR